MRYTFSFLSLLLLSFLLTAVPSAVFSETPRNQLREMEKELEKRKRQAKEARKKEKSILSEIEDLDRKLRTRRAEAKRYDRRLKETEKQMKDAQREISLLSDQLRVKKHHLRQRLKAIYKQQYGTNALLLISAKDHQDLVTRSRHLSLIAHHDSRQLTGFDEKLTRLQEKTTELKVLRAEQKKNKVQAQRKAEELKKERVKRDRLLATVRSKRGVYEKAVRELEDSSKKLREMIRKLETKEVPGTVTGRGFRAWRGRLPWPIYGKVLIPFGKYKDPKFDIPVFKNGIEIRASSEHDPKAVAGGRVVYADWFKGYGLLLIIDHGSGYHSLYGNLTEIFHNTGDIIERGTIVGKVGESRLLTVPTLYFEIRHKGKPLDPLLWLAKKKKT